MNKIITMLTLSNLLTPYTLNAEDKNYCEGTDVNMQWEALIHKHPDDMQINAFNTLWLGLCFNVSRKVLL